MTEFTHGVWTAGTRVMLLPIKGQTKESALSQPFYFQVPPLDSVAIQHAANHTDYDTVGREQLSRAGAVQLRQTSFQALMLDYDAPWAVWHRRGIPGPGGDPLGIDVVALADAFAALNPDWVNPVQGLPPVNPLLVTQRLRYILESRTPIRLQIGQPQVWGRFDLNMPATLRTMTVTERAGEPQDRYTDVAFTEYKLPDALQSHLAERFHGSLPATVTIYGSGTWTVGRARHKFPPTLHNLSAFFYGSVSSWRWITQHPQNRRLLRNVRPSDNLKEVALRLQRQHRSRHAWIKLTIPRNPHQAAKGHKRGKGKT